jgi:hypothetical protein
MVSDATDEPQHELCFNGINGVTGQPLLQPAPSAEWAKLIRGEQPDVAFADNLKKQREIELKLLALGPNARKVRDANKLRQAGWGVIFSSNAPAAIGEALAPLLRYRRAQAGNRYREFVYREFVEENGHRGEGSLSFLTRHGAGPGPPDPDKAPYYLLIVGDPETIPYRFQYQLDVQYAVGRIHFEKVEEYARYAQTVIEAESGSLVLPRTATFFGTANPRDRPTQLSSRYLVEPLAKCFSKASESTEEEGDPDSILPAGIPPGWQVTSVVGKDATKTRLRALLNDPESPTFLFSATHGVAFPRGDPRQRLDQGGLLCQEWPGPTFGIDEPVSRDHYLAADDISSHAPGRIAFFFACFGGGTPRENDFAHLSRQESACLAPFAFVASLPQRLLATGGALAVIAHVGLAWGHSFHWRKCGPQLQTFESTLARLLRGDRVGSALEDFNQRFAELSMYISEAPIAHDSNLVDLWTARNDARSYIVLGDPAVHLPLGPA